MMRDLFREGRNIDTARLRRRVEHDREETAHAPSLLIPVRRSPRGYIGSGRALFGFPQSVRCQRHR
jgi:hypothetical protein